MTIATQGIIHSGGGFGEDSDRRPDLTPAQALGQHDHYRRRLERRTRSYFAARERLTIAREEFARIDQLASQARVAWPVRQAGAA